jgi:mRNA interferase MazF
MPAYAFGDIVLVPFPFTDQSTTKRRPAVVVSSQAYNRERPDLILMAVTSQLRPAAGIGEVTAREWQAAGLLKPSAIKPVITTVGRGLVIRRLGRLSDPDREALKRAIQAILG